MFNRADKIKNLAVFFVFAILDTTWGRAISYHPGSLVFWKTTPVITSCIAVPPTAQNLGYFFRYFRTSATFPSPGCFILARIPLQQKKLPKVQFNSWKGVTKTYNIFCQSNLCRHKGFSILAAVRSMGTHWCRGMDIRVPSCEHKGRRKRPNLIVYAFS